MGLMMGFDHSLDLVMIRYRHPNPKMFCPAEERGNADRSIRVTCMNMHIHRGIALLSDFWEKRGSIAYSVMMRADHSGPGGITRVCIGMEEKNCYCTWYSGVNCYKEDNCRIVPK
jgi:hypothetical protein